MSVDASLGEELEGVAREREDATRLRSARFSTLTPPMWAGPCAAFDGEFWPDEATHYRQSIADRCGP